MKLPRFLAIHTRFSKVLGVALFIILPILSFFLGINYQKLNSLLVQPAISEKEFQIDPNVFDFKKELGDFPIYHNSLFIRKEKNPPCGEEKHTGFSTCSSISYIWQTRDDFNQVSSWYREDKSNSGWILSGGAGSYDGPRNAGGVSTIKKGNISRRLHIYADAVKTEITLEIPYEDYRGNYW
jgi:hypothetical protein